MHTCPQSPHFSSYYNNFSLVCLISSFCDSFIGTNEKLYYDIATRKGLHIFNKNKKDDGGNIEERKINDTYYKYRIQPIDFVHAFCSWLVFVVYAMCSSDVMRCFYPRPSDNVNVLMMNLPLAVGSAMSFLFMLFPTKRRGIGYADKGTSN
ncbi:hypothetical protein Ddye_028359 [Dipteronia dyeriana]|uniref:Uncharacterized protein n=1 Tax=Dipteronia dyeriana TaxID=168575 RepID=A0AAD9TRR4_9ROSI|nr:hypothetical protein Ddye_028359 [Dipteronia dyeriana]